MSGRKGNTEESIQTESDISNLIGTDNDTANARGADNSTAGSFEDTILAERCLHVLLGAWGAVMMLAVAMVFFNKSPLKWVLVAAAGIDIAVLAYLLHSNEEADQ